MMQMRGNNCSKLDSVGWIRPLVPSSSLFRENPLAGWKVTISANRRIGIPLLLHAREGVSYLRPSLNSPSVKSDQQSPRSLHLSPFLRSSLSPADYIPITTVYIVKFPMSLARESQLNNLPIDCDQFHYFYSS